MSLSNLENKKDDGLFHFPIDVDAVLLHLKQDMRDDWFPDCLQYEDLFYKKNNITEKVEGKIVSGHGVYDTDIRFIHDIPKSTLGLRYSLETDFYDRFIYQAICSFLMPYFDPLISNRVFSHRYNEHRTKEKYIFKNRIDLWQNFEGITKLGICDDNHLLVTDLLNYFEHISIGNIQKSFIDLLPKVKATGKVKSQIRSAIHTLCTLLEKWCFNNLHGLPQNRDASSFIANIVLSAVDKAMVEKGYDYFRYVDDIRIICKSEFHAKKALNILIFELRKLGMNINSKKTNIYSLSSSQSEKEELFPGFDERSIAIDNMWKSRSKNVIIRSIPELTNMLIELIEKNETQSRRFRFCINRIIKLVSTGLFKSGSILSNKVVGALIKALYEQPASSDQICRLLVDLKFTKKHKLDLENFITNDELCIYGWQNHHIWILLALKNISTKKTIDRAKCICNIQPIPSEASACFLFLAMNNEFKYLDTLAEKLDRTWSFQLQRHFLLAIRSSKMTSSPALIKHVLPAIQGTVRGVNMNKKLKNIFIHVNANPVSFSEIYNELSPYD